MIKLDSKIHVKIQKALLASNQKFIETACALSVEQYFEAQVETACLFLESKFDRNSEGGELIYQKLIQNEKFWRWWNHEFNLFVKRCINFGVIENHTSWFMNIDHVVSDPIVKKGYQSQLKVILSK